uniref:Putative secreted protein n=1 Tax=Anopheles darlingi TaxID=43151 RepID=A0A2M4D138_ANODA
MLMMLLGRTFYPFYLSLSFPCCFGLISEPAHKLFHFRCGYHGPYIRPSVQRCIHRGWMVGFIKKKHLKARSSPSRACWSFRSQINIKCKEGQ